MTPVPASDAALPGSPAFLLRITKARPGELRSVLWAFSSFAAMLGGYYVLRPLRDSLAVEAGVKEIPKFYTLTFLGTVLALPLWSFLVARLPRPALVRVTWRFFALSLVGFRVAFAASAEGDRVFVIGLLFAWISVMNMLTVSAFWSGLVDIFGAGEGRRLFGFIAGGGSLGALAGALLTFGFGGRIGAANLLLVPAVLYEVSARCYGRTRRPGTGADGAGAPATEEKPVREGNAWTGLRRLATSPYFLGIAAYQILLSQTSACAYSADNAIIGGAIRDPDAVRRLFAGMDVCVLVLSFAAQAFLTEKLIRRAGLGVSLAVLPLVTVAGFAAIGIEASVAVIAVAEVLRRVSEYGISSPSRAVLYTVVSRDAKYRTKNAIDTLVVRGSDVVAAWSFRALFESGLAAGTVLLGATPLGVLWLLLAAWLAARQSRLQARSPETLAP